jgi:3-oxoacyl-[acyl-carrier protein] reductase
MDLGLKGKVAVITGSSKGLGLATAKVLLDEEAKVVITSRSQENLNKALAKLGNSANLMAVPCDVTNPEDCHSLIEQTIAVFNKLDILIANCGGPDPGNFEDLSDEQWNQAVQKSFMSNVYLIRVALPYLKQSEAPSILTMTSFTTKMPLDNMLLSNSLRAGTIGLTKSLSEEFGVYHIRVNSILPGWTMTDRVSALMQNRAQKYASTPDEESAKITKDIPLGRMADPAEFGRVAAFLVSPAASYVNGVMLNVDGGINKGLF